MARGLVRPPRTRRDDGAVLILFALSITAIFLILALVIDLSNVRNTRQDSKSTTDAATAAGLQSLGTGGVLNPWSGVCNSLAYLLANQPNRSFTVTYHDGHGVELATSNDPCSTDPDEGLLEEECVPDDKDSWAWIRATDGDAVADIRSGYTFEDSGFPEDLEEYASDDGDASKGGCDQLAVILSNQDPAFFGGIAGASDYETATRSVGRAVIATEGEAVPAFLMLERQRCKVLTERVGSSEGGIIVQPASPTESATIHVDSAGSPSAGCTGNMNADGWAVYSSGSSGPKIVAQPSGARPGVISIHALEIGQPPTAYGAPVDAGVSPNATPGSVVSRQPVDDKYNPGANETIRTIHNTARTDVNTAPAGYALITTCTNHDVTTGDPAFSETHIFVQCPSGYSPRNVTFNAATDVIFNGPVDISNNDSLFMPAATRVVVGGTTGGGLTVRGPSGRLGINSRTFSTDVTATDGVPTACAGRSAPSHTRTTQLVIFGGGSSGQTEGALNISGQLALCQTFVHLAGPKTLEYERQTTLSSPSDPSCIPEKPCPTDAASSQTQARLLVSGRMKWTAPNQFLSTRPPEGAVGVEDLALWTESSYSSRVTGTVEVSGVLFLPNAGVVMQSPADMQPEDAQFIARSLELIQGTLFMKPTPANSVPVDILRSAGLVR